MLKVAQLVGRAQNNSRMWPPWAAGWSPSQPLSLLQLSITQTHDPDRQADLSFEEFSLKILTPDFFLQRPGGMILTIDLSALIDR